MFGDSVLKSSNNGSSGLYVSNNSILMFIIVLQILSFAMIGRGREGSVLADQSCSSRAPKVPVPPMIHASVTLIEATDGRRKEGSNTDDMTSINYGSKSNLDDRNNKYYLTVHKIIERRTFVGD